MGDRPAARTTVVVPVWDAYVAERLVEAVGSLRQQDVSAQVLVVDNASQVALPTLAGASVVKSRARLTLGAARNLGLTHVSTSYVVFWDADDLMLPGTLASLEEAITGDPELVAFGQAILQEPGGGRYRWPRRWIRFVLRWPRLFVLLHSAWSIYPATGATIMRAESVRSAGGYADADSGQDWCLGVSLAFRGRLGWSERPGRVYRVYKDSVSQRHGEYRDLLRHAATLRTWIRNDPATPAFVRRALPVIHIAQYAAVIGHFAVDGTRRMGWRRQH